MVELASEQGVTRRKYFQGALPACFLLLAGQLVETLPNARLDDGHRNPTQRDRRFDGADGAPVFETAAAALFRHCLSAFYEGVLDVVLADPRANCDRIDALFGVRADDRNVDRLDQPRGYAVLDGDDGNGREYRDRHP